MFFFFFFSEPSLATYEHLLFIFYRSGRCSINLSVSMSCLTPALNAFQVSWMKAVDLGHKIRLMCVILVLTVLSDST